FWVHWLYECITHFHGRTANLFSQVASYPDKYRNCNALQQHTETKLCDLYVLPGEGRLMWIQGLNFHNASISLPER
ncbi:MAG: hypothetical protein ACO3K4_05895, partial [Paracoccaceae bacterium]